MLITFATAPGSASRPNEDFALATPHAAIVLDGAGGPAELGSGCIHGTPWYVQSLGAHVLEQLVTQPHVSLPDALAEGIAHVTRSHADTCDLDNPGTPSATVVMVREQDQHLEYLVLSDAVLVVEGRAGTQFFSDRRIDDIGPEIRERMRQFCPGSDEHQAERLKLVTEQRRLRNRPGGHWVAATAPEAAAQALGGLLPIGEVQHVALLSDGAGRYVDFGLGDWRDLMNVLSKSGPEGLIAQVRRAEREDADGITFPRTKRYDDATAMLATLTPEEAPAP